MSDALAKRLLLPATKWSPGVSVLETLSQPHDTGMARDGFKEVSEVSTSDATAKVVHSWLLEDVPGYDYEVSVEDYGQELIVVVRDDAGQVLGRLEDKPRSLTRTGLSEFVKSIVQARANLPGRN